MSNKTRRAAVLLSAPLVLGFILAPVVPLADSSPLAVALSAPASVFVVTSAGDSGAGSLRQAILDANAHPGADTIVFNIPGSGLHTITPLRLCRQSPIRSRSTVRPSRASTAAPSLN